MMLECCSNSHHSNIVFRNTHDGDTYSKPRAEYAHNNSRDPNLGLDLHVPHYFWKPPFYFPCPTCLAKYH